MSTYYKRALSLREADRCENAREPKCVCRCGGAGHGRARIGAAFDREAGNVQPTDAELAPMRAEFEALPKDDPHHLPTKEEAWTMARDRETHRRYHNQPWAYEFVEKYDYVSGNSIMRTCVVCESEGRPTRAAWNAAHPTPVDA